MSTDNSFGRDSHRSIIKSTSILSLGTATSRVFGFIRDILLARILGTGMSADALFVAFKIPNLFRSFVGEGATDSAVVPVFSEYSLKQDRKEYGYFISTVLLAAFIALGLTTILGIVLSPVIVRVIAPGFMADHEKLALTISLTRVIFPYLIFIGLTAFGTAILYTSRLFVMPAFSPSLFNLAMIAGALVAMAWNKEPVYCLAVGILAGGFLQALAVFFPVVRTGIEFQFPRGLRHAGLQKIATLLLPRMIGAGVYQLTIFVDTFCASLSMIVGQGGISAIYYANRIVQFPLGVFITALASAVLPTLSGFAAAGDRDRLKEILTFSLKNMFFIMLPTSIILIVLAHPVIRLLFERGDFTAYSTLITASALLFYSAGLFSFGGTKILITAFYATQDTKTPVKIAAICLAVNAALNFILMWRMKISGIALASSIASMMNFMMLFRVMDRRVGGFDPALAKFLLKILFASLLAGFIAMQTWARGDIINEYVRLFSAGALAYLAYGILCLGLKIEQATKIYRWILRKK